MLSVFLDVNVPMYAAGSDHALKEPCKWIMEAIVEGRINAVIDTEIIQEILYRYGAIRRRELGARLAEDVLAIVPTVYSVTPEDARESIELFKRHNTSDISPRGCLHAAVMLNRGIESIISVDEDFNAMEGVKRIDPLALYQQET